MAARGREGDGLILLLVERNNSLDRERSFATFVLGVKVLAYPIVRLNIHYILSLDR